MSGNTFGKLFTITSFGESHGPTIGVVIDGMPSNIHINLEDLQKELTRRAPGKKAGTSNRQESDKPEILSGIFEGKTLGTPIAVLVKNTNQRSEDYEQLKNEYRPGHADETYMLKYGIRDHRGGGRASARETIARVIGGYFAGLIIPQIQVRAWVSKLGPFESKVEFVKEVGEYGLPTHEHDSQIAQFLLDLKAKGESVGGLIQLTIDQCPPGLGLPVFDKLKADLAKAMLSIPACMSFSYGDLAFIGSEMSGNRDNFGGIEGGISNGRTIKMQLAFKPTSTQGIHAQQGRHDPCVVPRALPIVESMAKIVLADHFLINNAYKNL